MIRMQSCSRWMHAVDRVFLHVACDNVTHACGHARHAAEPGHACRYACYCEGLRMKPGLGLMIQCFLLLCAAHSASWLCCTRRRGRPPCVRPRPASCGSWSARSSTSFGATSRRTSMLRDIGCSSPCPPSSICRRTAAHCWWMHSQR